MASTPAARAVDVRRAAARRHGGRTRFRRGARGPGERGRGVAPSRARDAVGRRAGGGRAPAGADGRRAPDASGAPVSAGEPGFGRPAPYRPGDAARRWRGAPDVVALPAPAAPAPGPAY